MVPSVSRESSGSNFDILPANSGGRYAAPQRTRTREVRSAAFISGWLTSWCTIDGTRVMCVTRYLTLEVSVLCVILGKN
jgi:hypothetical protein